MKKERHLTCRACEELYPLSPPRSKADYCGWLLPSAWCTVHTVNSVQSANIRICQCCTESEPLGLGERLLGYAVAEEEEEIHGRPAT